jgi:Zn-dependent peptidase ImmA (M78 family)
MDRLRLNVGHELGHLVMHSPLRIHSRHFEL